MNSADNIYFRKGVTAANCVGERWVQVPGKLKQIEVTYNVFYHLANKICLIITKQKIVTSANW